MRGLYAIVDTDALDARGLDPLRFATAVLAARPAALQLRAKGRSSRDTLSLLRQLAQLSGDVPIFANDRPDLAALAQCDGVHLGQHDVPPQAARHVFEAMGVPGRVGMSVHNADELEVALASTSDYIAFGPVFETANKAAPEPCIGVDGLLELTAAARQRTTVPFVAIGGIDVQRVAEVAAICPCIATIGALLADDYAGVTARADRFARAIESHA
jgi:thiamine-phosphate pyrophosphorylase